MYDKGKIFAGLAIFLFIITSPIWYNVLAGKADYRPEIKLPVDEKQCVAPKDYMTASHMTLLDTWRDKVVREGVREFVAWNGKVYNMSLSEGCMHCHTDRAAFCDQCHNYVNVSVTCWDCHVEPKEKK